MTEAVRYLFSRGTLRPGKPYHNSMHTVVIIGMKS